MVGVNRDLQRVIRAGTAPPRTSSTHRGQIRPVLRTPVDRSVGAWYSIRKYIAIENWDCGPKALRVFSVAVGSKSERAWSR